MEEPIDLAVHENGVAVMTLNRPESLNSMNRAMLIRLPEVAREAAERDDIRCVVVTGAGRGFCAGGDMKGGSSQVVGDDPNSKLGLRDFEEASRLLHEMPKPTIAAVNGPAFGAGFSLALSADFRIASEAARFGTAFARMAFSGDFGGSWFLQRMVGWAVARDLYLLGEPMDAQRALELRLVREVVPHDELMPAAMALGARLAAGPTKAYALMKENLNFGATSTLADLLTQEATNMGISGKTDDHREAVMAFIEKREPAFTGS